MSGRIFKAGFAAALYLGVVSAMMAPAMAAAPDPANSSFVPEAGSVKNPFTGGAAVQFFRVCPNNDGGASLPNNARIRVTLHDATGLPPSPPVPASSIYLLFNGGTAAQGFGGSGADSIIANGVWNTSPLCPTVTKIYADAATDANGVTYITFTGATAAPGVGARDGNRKWGHYDQEIPVYLEVGGIPYQLSSPILYKGSPYKLRIKNFDHTGGLAAAVNQGEAVTSPDYNGVVVSMFQSSTISYWRDFDDDGYVALPDFDMITVHVTHDCDTPNGF